ncbi:MAG: DUF2029 domain-containing protein [Verrucomicrobiae bacterium]|nr:DUF2029 domain-containing protein [Verrucomicrobiae bacterium]
MASLKNFAAQQRVSLFIFFIVQSVIFITWAPLDKGKLNPALSFVGAVPMSLPYGDYKVIASAIQYHELGGNPYENGIFDFAGRKYNYPAYWLEMPFLGFDQAQIKYVYIVFATLFAIGLSLAFWNDRTKAWYSYLPFIFSPPVFLALERCNYELIVFFLVVLAVWICFRSRSHIAGWIGGGMMYLATVLKVFPVFGFIIFVRDSWKKTFLFLTPFAILSAAYFAYSRPYLKLVHENTPWSQFLSFGLNVLPFNIAKWIAPESKVLPVYFLALAWLLAAVMILIGFRQGKRKLPGDGTGVYDAALFRGASCIYIAVFLMGSNFDYRLLFLLATLPFIFRMLREDTMRRSVYTMYLGCMLVGMWFSEANLLWRYNTFGRSFVLALNELCCWGLFFISVLLQFQLLPPFLREIIYRESAGSK